MNTFFDLYFRKRSEMIKAINGKLKLAKKRRECMAMEKRVNRMAGQIDFCKRHSAFRQEVLQKNIKLYEMYKEEQRNNVEVS